MASRSVGWRLAGSCRRNTSGRNFRSLPTAHTGLHSLVGTWIVGSAGVGPVEAADSRRSVAEHRMGTAVAAAAPVSMDLRSCCHGGWSRQNGLCHYRHSSLPTETLLKF